MAIQKTQERLNKVLNTVYNRMEKGLLPKELGSSVVVRAKLGGFETVRSMKEGGDHAFAMWGGSFHEKANTLNEWGKALKKSLQKRKDFRGKPFKLKPKRAIPGPGIYIESQFLTQAIDPFINILFCYRKYATGTPAKSDLSALIKDIKDKTWEHWYERNVAPMFTPGAKAWHGATAAGGLLPGTPVTRVSSRRTPRYLAHAKRDWGERVQASHQQTTTKGVMTLHELERMPNIRIGYGMTTYNLIDELKNNMSIDYEDLKERNDVGDYTFDTYFEIKLDTNPVMPFDMRRLRPALHRLVEAEINKDPYLTDPQKGRSKSPKDQAIDDVIESFKEKLKPYKTTKVTLNPAKKFKKKPRKAKLIKSKPSKIPKSVLVSVAGKPKKVRKRTTGSASKGTGASQENLIRLKSNIQRSLSAQMRRNMGKEGRLHNRTGTFSNSAQLLNLRQTKGGISGEYTYQKFPYQTFEPGFAQGKDRWDPKKLITMSIRELALKYSETRFTQLRRT